MPITIFNLRTIILAHLSMSNHALLLTAILSIFLFYVAGYYAYYNFMPMPSAERMIYMEKTSLKQKKVGVSLKNMVVIAMFAALCYISLMVFFIPFGTMYVHVGNLIVVTAALLCGGWQGGLAGSIGMGLFDLLGGHADSAPKTIVLKFLIGLIVGIVFKTLISRAKFPSIALAVSGVVSLMVSQALTVYTLSKYGFFSTKTIILAPVFLVIGIICIVFAFLGKKFNPETASAIVSAVCGMTVNILGETIYKFFYWLIAGSNTMAAATSAVLAQGSTLINAGLAIVGGVSLYLALKKPFASLKKGNK